MFIPALIFLASATFGAPTTLADSATVTMTEQQIASSSESLEQYVEEYFSDTPILADIARCESHMRHLDKNGNILRGEVDSDDIGVMQINLRYHSEDAEELGIDLYSLSGNLEYAKHLYKKQGVKPWKASRGCWGHLAQK